MKESLALSGTTSSPESWIDALARRIVHRSLSKITRGHVTLLEGGLRSEFGAASDGDSRPLRATVYVENPEAYRGVAFGGSVGAGTAYVEGRWRTDDLPTLIRIFALNREAMFGLEGGVARVLQPFLAVGHLFRRNTRRGSRRNIEEHYDLGNDFYRVFLDETMAYSCGIFDHEEATMREASEKKFERICRKLRLSPEDHLLEIGTGWGGFAVHAARHYGCRVTTTTISKRQYDLARQRVVREGLDHLVEVVLRDYRDLHGTYDKLVSIEMIEAVGEEYFDLFFEKCSRLLAPNGLMALQAITISDQEFERHRREVDFIKRYIFPGSCIPSVTALVQSMTRSGDLRLFDLEDITRHYVTTLQRWRQAFRAGVGSIRSMGFADRFIRMWDFYLGYCEGGFAERYLGNVQMVLAKPEWRD